MQGRINMNINVKMKWMNEWNKRQILPNQWKNVPNIEVYDQLKPMDLEWGFFFSKIFIGTSASLNE